MNSSITIPWHATSVQYRLGLVHPGDIKPPCTGWTFHHWLPHLWHPACAVHIQLSVSSWFCISRRVEAVVDAIHMMGQSSWQSSHLIHYVGWWVYKQQTQGLELVWCPWAAFVQHWLQNPTGFRRVSLSDFESPISGIQSWRHLLFFLHLYVSTQTDSSWFKWLTLFLCHLVIIKFIALVLRGFARFAGLHVCCGTFSGPDVHV